MTNTISNIYAKQIENKDYKIDRKVTFILGTGRCGSTLAQRLINASPQAIIWGEHQGFLRAIATGYFQVLQSKMLNERVFQQPGKYSISHIMDKEKISRNDLSWMNDFDESALKSYFKAFIESIFCNQLPSSVSCWGFKEIRYGVDSNDQSMDMLLELFPKSRNIIMTRHPFNTVISMLSAWNPALVDQSKNDSNSSEKLKNLAQNYLRKWSTQNQKLLDYAQCFPDNFIWIKYEDFNSKFDDSVFEFIGVESPKDLKQVLDTKIMHTHKSQRAEIVRQHLHTIQANIWEIVESKALELGYEPYELNKAEV